MTLLTGQCAQTMVSICQVATVSRLWCKATLIYNDILRFSLYRYLAISLFLQNNTDMPPSGACDMSVLYVSTLPRYPLYSYVEVYIISMRYYIALMPHLLLLPKLSLTCDINLYLHLSHCSLPNALSSLDL